MEKKDLLGVRMKPSPAAKRRRRVSAGGGGGRLGKAIAEYLASDSYMYAPLVSDPQPPPTTTTKKPAEAPAATGSHEKEVTMESLVQKYRGSWRGTFTAC